MSTFMPQRVCVTCPTCGNKVEWTAQQRWRPFCSERCRLIDLGKWADEEHRIPAAESTPPEDTGDAAH
jgi:endogenous inhibitor of DNA gyrase (YacG/DUF329 family)